MAFLASKCAVGVEQDTTFKLAWITSGWIVFVKAFEVIPRRSSKSQLVSDEIIWTIVCRELPALKKEVDKLVKKD